MSGCIRVWDAREKKQDEWGEWAISDWWKEKTGKKIAQQQQQQKKNVISDYPVYEESTE